MNNWLENWGLFFGLRLLAFLVCMIVVAIAVCFIYLRANGTYTNAAPVQLLSLLQALVALWFFLFLIAYPSLLARLDETGVRRRPGALTVEWHSIHRVQVTRVPGARFLDKLILFSATDSVTLYFGQYRRRRELMAFIAGRIHWLREEQLTTPCDLVRPPDQ